MKDAHGPMAPRVPEERIEGIETRLERMREEIESLRARESDEPLARLRAIEVRLDALQGWLRYVAALSLLGLALAVSRVL